MVTTIKIRQFLKPLVKQGTHALLVDAYSVLFGAYLLIAKVWQISASELLKGCFTDSAILVSKKAALWLFVYSMFIKVVELIFKHFPVDGTPYINPSVIRNCVRQVRDSTEKRLIEVESNPVQFPSANGIQQSKKDDCIVFIGQLHEHIVDKFKTNKVTKKDVFISLYKANGATALNQLIHFPLCHTKNTSTVIDLSVKKYQVYECAKCIKSGQKMRFTHNAKGEYSKSAAGSDRYKKVEHYFGLNIKHGNESLGFLNIEFSKKLFEDEMIMREFVETELLPFLDLIENSFLNLKFCSKIKGA